MTAKSSLRASRRPTASDTVHSGCGTTSWPAVARRTRRRRLTSATSPRVRGGPRGGHAAQRVFWGPENTAIVFDVGLLDAWDDDADQGFYKDNSFSGKDLTFIAEKANSIAERLK